MTDPSYSVPFAALRIRRDAWRLVWLSIGFCLGSLVFPWNNIVVRIQPTGAATPPIITQQAFYGIFMPHGWMLVGLIIWLVIFLLSLRKYGADWLETRNGLFSRIGLICCLLGLSLLIIQAFVYGVARCGSCPEPVIGWGIYGALVGLPLAAASLWRIHTR